MFPRYRLCLEDVTEVSPQPVGFGLLGQNLTFWPVNFDPSEWLFRCKLPDDSIHFVWIARLRMGFCLQEEMIDPLSSGQSGSLVGSSAQSPKACKVVPAPPSTQEIISRKPPIVSTPSKKLPPTMNHLLNFRVIVCIFPPAWSGREVPKATIIQNLMQCKCVHFWILCNDTLHISLEVPQLRRSLYHCSGNGIMIYTTPRGMPTAWFPAIIQLQLQRPVKPRKPPRGNLEVTQWAALAHELSNLMASNEDIVDLRTMPLMLERVSTTT